MSKISNSRKDSFIKSIPLDSLEEVKADICSRCKFNFSYFDANQKYATDLEGWDENNLQLFFSKLKLFSRFPLSHWQHKVIGSHKNHVLEIYGAFPKKSCFKHPPHVPSDVDWARFRLDRKKRLIGFTIPKSHCVNNTFFDENVFYIVFLDLEHKFYLK